MPSRKLSLRRASCALLALVSLLFAALPAPVTRPAAAQSCPPSAPPQSQPPRSFGEFITLAYLGALNREPTCDESAAAYDGLAQAYYSNNLSAGARRFVATLFITQASYDFSVPYQQTAEYEARRPVNPSDPKDVSNQAAREAFVTDLYRAFLQREPDAGGLCYWQNTVALYGRRSVSHAFEVSSEFDDLVTDLYPGTAPNCGPCGGMTCPTGQTLDLETCTCEEPCVNEGGGYGQLCP